MFERRRYYPYIAGPPSHCHSSPDNLVPPVTVATDSNSNTNTIVHILYKHAASFYHGHLIVSKSCPSHVCMPLYIWMCKCQLPWQQFEYHMILHMKCILSNFSHHSSRWSPHIIASGFSHFDLCFTIIVYYILPVMTVHVSKACYHLYQEFTTLTL